MSGRTRYLSGPDILVALEGAGITLFELWVYYCGIGGNFGALDVEAFLFELNDLPAPEASLLCHGLFEMLADQEDLPAGST